MADMNKSLQRSYNYYLLTCIQFKGSFNNNVHRVLAQTLLKIRLEKWSGSIVLCM